MRQPGQPGTGVPCPSQARAVPGKISPGAPDPALVPQAPDLEAPAVDADLDTLLTALYVEVDDHIITGRRGPGRPPRLSDAKLACLAVAQVLLGFTSERRWLRFARTRLGDLFPYLPHQPGYHKRLKAAAPLLAAVIDHLARQAPCWHDQIRLIDATPLPCGTTREKAKRSDLAGWAGKGTAPPTPASTRG